MTITVEEGLRTQLRNIETTYGRSIAEWVELIRGSGLIRHGQIVAMLKADHGLTHGSANRVALVALDAIAAKPAEADPVAALYAGDKSGLLPIHGRLMAALTSLVADIEIAPKRGYLSLRRRKQFAMIKPATNSVELGLILPGLAGSARLEAVGAADAMFSHRARIRTIDEVDPELIGWLTETYARAG